MLWFVLLFVLLFVPLFVLFFVLLFVMLIVLLFVLLLIMLLLFVVVGLLFVAGGNSCCTPSLAVGWFCREPQSIWLYGDTTT